MDYLKNHCWCSSSHWDNKDYNCQIIVSLSSYKEGYVEDWDNLTDRVEVFSQEKFDNFVATIKRLQIKYPERYQQKDITDRGYGTSIVNKLKPKVLDWLRDNVTDQGNSKGWCVGSDDYIVGGSSTGLSVFFQRRKDAMLFIKTWSKWKKPINYCQYFTDVRKRLNLETGKYES